MVDRESLIEAVAAVVAAAEAAGRQGGKVARMEYSMGYASDGEELRDLRRWWAAECEQRSRFEAVTAGKVQDLLDLIDDAAGAVG